MPTAVETSPRKSPLPVEPRSAKAAAKPSKSFDQVLSRQAKPKTDDAPKPDAAEQPEATKPKDADDVKAKKKPGDVEETDAAEGVEEPSDAESSNPVTAAPTLPQAGDEGAASEGDAEEEVPEVVAGEKKADDTDPAIDLAALIQPQQQPVVEAVDTVPETTDAPITAVTTDAAPADSDAEAPAPQTAVAKPVAATTKAQTDTAGDETPSDEQPADGFKLPETPDAPTPAAEFEIDLPPAPPAPAPAPVAASPAPVAPQPPEQKFVEQNTPNIVQSVRTELLPSGGTMKLQMTPDHLGKLQIDVTVQDGVVTAAFQTSNDEATRLLSHSLQQLKTSLETAGVTVDKIQVKQAAPAEQSSSSQNQSGDDNRQQSQQQQDHSARQEQQRRAALERMWRRVSVGEDPLDLVA